MPQTPTLARFGSQRAAPSPTMLAPMHAHRTTSTNTAE